MHMLFTVDASFIGNAAACAQEGKKSVLQHAYATFAQLICYHSPSCKHPLANLPHRCSLVGPYLGLMHHTLMPVT